MYLSDYLLIQLGCTNVLSDTETTQTHIQSK